MDQFCMTKLYIMLLVVICAVGIVGCNLPSQDTSTATLNVTQAYQTVEARLTEAISRTPTISPSPARATATQGLPSPSSTQSIQTVTQAITQTPSADCDRALPGVPIDVTIPDDTKFRPGERFTKTWRLQNAGTCTWTSEYSLVWFSGEQLNAQLSVPLIENTAPGGSADMSVDMVAPETAGTYQSWWKLSNPSGALFGIGPNYDAAFWVRIVVEGAPLTTGTPTVTETTSPAPTLTPTPGVQVSGPATLQIGKLYDLDNNLINSGGEDLSYEEVAQVATLNVIDNTVMSVFGPNQPTLNDCQNINLSPDPVSVNNLAGSYICYRTNMALPGWMYINSLNSENGNLNVDIFTWLIP
jgi:hypothetical protein